MHSPTKRKIDTNYLGKVHVLIYSLNHQKATSSPLTHNSMRTDIKNWIFSVLSLFQLRAIVQYVTLKSNEIPIVIVSNF